MSGAVSSALQARAAPGNRVLRILPHATLARLAPHLRHVELLHHAQLHRAGEPNGTIHFVDSGMVSLVQRMRDGRAVEVGAFGTDSIAGADAFVGTGSTIVEAIVQIGGHGRSMDADILAAESHRCKVLEMLLQGCVQLQVAQIAQTAACNRLHTLEQRCCRWLLTAHSSAGSDTFPLTHDFLAMMLGVQRPGVTIAARAMQSRGLIEYTRGRITILDRDRLLEHSCECYGTIRAEVEALFGAALALRE
jgi:CRP-like cAMP-binding protein